jgi:hypothetical protein
MVAPVVKPTAAVGGRPRISRIQFAAISSKAAAAGDMIARPAF